MDPLSLAGAILGILGRVGEGVAQAIQAAKQSEDEAFAILENALTETAAGLMTMRAKLKRNREDAQRALEERFPEGNAGERGSQGEDTDPGTPAAMAAKVDKP